MNKSIKEITTLLQGQLILGNPKTMVTDVSIDSRHIVPGCLFFAFKGEHADGHHFAVSASLQGAAGLVVSHLDWFKSDLPLEAAIIRVNDTFESLRHLGRSFRNEFKGPVVGITGSNGKTTTKQMTSSILASLGPGLSTPGNYNSQIGLPLVLSKLSPDHKWMVLEMGASAPGNIATLAEVAHPSLGIITTIGPSHLETFGSVERIAETKWELMDSLPSDGCAIVPWGNPHLEPLVRRFRKKLVFFGDASSCPVRSSSVEAGEKVRFMLHIGSQSAPVTLPIPGRHNVMNALAAAAAGWTLGCSLESIVQGLERFEPPQMRMQVMKHPSGAVFINDAYNANPSSMLVAIRSLVESYPKKKRILVLGPMLELGSDSEKYHFHLGSELAHFSMDHVILVGQEAQFILEGAISSAAPKQKFSTFSTTQEVVPALKKYLTPEHVVLLKASRGIKLENILDGLEIKQVQTQVKVV
ncbi:MAG: UDP-N-acetylmuramoyl-tripeptide--D-alanyl-D-alanine ligase [Elusimicrobia bacterium]|nr:UDP-N-acetylmuramoyl-tripeptide--D-alanyl-D-alanine ligase [Elusimicrobiota bacterium]